MRTVPHHYQSEAESLSGWQDQVESSPVGFGDGRSLLTEKKNTVQENTEILNKVYGNRNSLGAAAYKLDGYSKQALSKKSWLNQNKKKQGKRLVRTKKSASKHSSPRHHTSPKEKLEREREREREREWQDGPGLAKPSTLERKTSTSSARKSRHSPPRPPPPQDLFEVAISGHFLQKMVLNAWYAETCESIENQLRGLRAQDRRQRRLLVAILITWQRVTAKNARLQRLALKYSVNNKRRLAQVAFRWWKQSLESKLSGLYFLQKSRKYDLHRKFRAWKKTSMLSLSKSSYLHIMEKHLVLTKKKDKMRTFWNAWRGTFTSSVRTTEVKDGAKDLRQVVRLWSLQTKLRRMEDLYNKTVSSPLATNKQKMKENQSYLNHDASARQAKLATDVKYMLDDKGNVIKHASFEEEGPEKSQISKLQSKQRELAREHQQTRNAAMESISSMNRFLGDLNAFFTERSASSAAVGEGAEGESPGDASILESLRDRMQVHMDRAASAEKETVAALRDEMQTEVERKQAQICRMIDASNRKQMLKGAWTKWVTLASESKQIRALIERNMRRVLSQSRFKWLKHHLLLRWKLAKTLALQPNCRAQKVRLLFTSWRKDALVSKIHRGKTRIFESRHKKLSQYSVLKHWRAVASARRQSRGSFHEKLRNVCNSHLNLANLVRVWQAVAACNSFEEKIFAKAERSFGLARHRRLVLAWQEEAERLAHNRRVQAAAVEKMRRSRIRHCLAAWRAACDHDRRLKVVEHYVSTQRVKRTLASHFSTWCASVAEIRHTRNKQQLKKLIKQMQKMLSRSKEKLETVEGERDEASKKVGDLVTAVTNLNWKIQFGTSPVGGEAQTAASLPRTPVLHITRK